MYLLNSLVNKTILIRVLLGLITTIVTSNIARADVNAQATHSNFDLNAIVAIKIQGAKDFCSGVVISPDEVLTATHCIYDLNNQKYFVTNEIKIGVGHNIFDKSFDWVEVEKILAKPDATVIAQHGFLENDIVRLKTRGTLGVTPLQIAPQLNSGSTFYAWGFGEDEWGYYGIKKVRPLEATKLEYNFITFTAGACRGDSGGPILNELNQVVGIISLSTVRHCVEEGERIAQRIGGI